MLMFIGSFPREDFILFREDKNISLDLYSCPIKKVKE
jgi:hypothetical protein